MQPAHPRQNLPLPSSQTWTLVVSLLCPEPSQAPQMVVSQDRGPRPRLAIAPPLQWLLIGNTWVLAPPLVMAKPPSGSLLAVPMPST